MPRPSWVRSDRSASATDHAHRLRPSSMSRWRVNSSRSRGDSDMPRGPALPLLPPPSRARVVSISTASGDDDAHSRVNFSASASSPTTWAWTGPES